MANGQKHFHRLGKLHLVAMKREERCLQRIARKRTEQNCIVKEIEIDCFIAAGLKLHCKVGRHHGPRLVYRPWPWPRSRVVVDPMVCCSPSFRTGLFTFWDLIKT
ncbi:hypothetical protein SUGI_0286500 [Cryptomeria japonica]|nr:hypothetical protein SUGI_0286500 [Cryptomeria japonica]